MSLSYQFASLNDEQLQQRRRLLDSYGQFAQLSVLLLPLIYQLSTGIRLLVLKFHKSKREDYHELKEHGSPAPSQSRGELSESSASRWATTKWWLDDPVYPGWDTRKEILIAGAWALWLLYLTFAQTGDDYMHLTKRFGIVAASQLPIHYLLSAKGWSPIQYLTRMSHEELNPYHRLLGRIIVFLFACHASLYLNFFVQKGVLLKRMRDRDVFLGLTAISSAVVLSTTALATLRHYSYRLFFYVHVAVAIFLIPVLYFHVSHIRIYIIETVFVFLGIIVQRNLSQSTLPATIEQLGDETLLHITIPLTSKSRFRDTKAGQHIYLGFPSLPKKLIKNPFTVANSHKDGQPSLKLVMRMLAGTTSTLTALRQQPQPIGLVVEGPYGSSKYFPQLHTYDRVLLIAGGVGATFLVPIFASLRDRMNKGRVELHWVTRSIDEFAWARDDLFYDKDIEAVNAYLTGNELMEDDGEDVVLCAGQDGLWKRLSYRRPDLRQVVDTCFEHHEGDRVAVLVCGPSGLGTGVRKEVGKWVHRGRDVWWHNEHFGW